MSNASSLSARKPSMAGGLWDARRVSKPQLSRLILVGTGLIVAVVLLIWLLLHWRRERMRIDGLWISHAEAGRPWIAHQAADVAKVVAPHQGGDGRIAQDTFARS